MFRLLIAENEYIEREAMKHILSQRYGEKYEIIEAANGKEAVEKAREFQPEVLFLDIKMPGYSGIEAGRQIREFLPNARIVFVSAYDFFDYAKEAISLRAEEFLVKPVDIDLVYETMERITERLKEEQKTIHENKELEYKFLIIKKQFQLEFFELLNSYDTPKETLERYIQVMDISMKGAVCVYLDFGDRDTKEKPSAIQREFSRNRYMDKCKQMAGKYGFTIIHGEPAEQVQMIFFFSNEEMEDQTSVIGQLLERCNGMLGMSCRYYVGKVLKEVDKLSNEMFRLKQKMVASKKQKEKEYPYELEAELSECIRKREFEQCKQLITELATVFEMQYEGGEFTREVLGLFAVLKRVMLRTSPDLLLKNADELLDGMKSKGEMIGFFHRLFDYAIVQLDNKQDKNQILIENICRYIEEHYKEDISLEQAASRIGFSPYYFARLMKEYRDMSFVDYITSVRIANAKKLLETTPLSVKEVGYEVGYEDPNYFTRVFKRMEGRTPSQYKNSFL